MSLEVCLPVEVGSGGRADRPLGPITHLHTRPQDYHGSLTLTSMFVEKEE